MESTLVFFYLVWFNYVSKREQKEDETAYEEMKRNVMMT